MDKDKKKIGLYICATPIGNLEDASYRLINTLKDVDIIAAEDTRTTKKLLERYSISGKRIISYHDFSESNRLDLILSYLLDGRTVALVSESGMPLVSDPGYRLVSACVKKEIGITVIPGPSAGLSSLALSGLATDSFLFIGFLAKSKGKREKKILEIAAEKHTLIFYESPKRIIKLIQELVLKLGNRRAFLARELTKLHEEKIWGNLDQIKDKLSLKEKIKGEITLIVEGFKGELVKDFTEQQLKQEMLSLITQGLNKKDAIKVLMAKYDIDRQRLYNISTKF